MNSVTTEAGQHAHTMDIANTRNVFLFYTTAVQCEVFESTQVVVIPYVHIKLRAVKSKTLLFLYLTFVCKGYRLKIQFYRFKIFEIF